MPQQSCKLVFLGVFFALLSISPVYAGRNCKISNYGGGHQIWFESEDYSQRDPDTDAYFKVVDAAGAFGKAVTRTGGAGGLLRYTFDISTADGKGGTWYFWGRVIVPNNNSDWMIVEGNPGEPAIPSSPPYPGTSSAPGFTSAQQIFEENLGPSWTWGRTSHGHGHTKQLRDGENTMYILHRQGKSENFWDVFMWTDSASYVPTDEDYRNAVTPVRGKASGPSPAVGAVDVPRDIVLSWASGLAGQKHDVYFGTNAADVIGASVANPLGVLAGAGQSANTFDPAGLLQYGTTYYWRIDEVNTTPDATVLKGATWSFTVEPYAYPIKNVTATASSTQAGMEPVNTVNGSGLSTNDRHSTDAKQMWLSAGVAPNWIQYEFDKAYKLDALWVWNSNQAVESIIGFGAKDVTIEYSTDGSTWSTLAGVPVFTRAPGSADYAHDTVVNFGGVPAKYVKLTITSTWGGMAQCGLSEVRFFYVPVQAREPVPAANASGQELDLTLNWRPGREAVSHKVYLNTDANAVANGAVAAKTVSTHSYDVTGLNFGTAYYWRVDEVNDVATPASWPGDVWAFTTREYQVIDNFESYTNDSPNRVFQTWIDGWGFSKDPFFPDGNPGNGTGATIGYDPLTGNIMEKIIVHGDKQAMPFDYNDAIQPYYAETDRTWATPQNWVAGGADTLSLYFRGRGPSFIQKASGNIVMGAGGVDIWGTADEFRFAWKRLSGNGTIVARVESIERASDWVKAGVMIRESLNPGSRFAAVYITPDYGCRFQARAMTSTAAVSDSAVATPEQIAIKAPYWVKMERTGNDLKAYYSANGTTWTSMVWNPQTITMTGDIYIGLALTSHTAAAQAVAEFSGVATTGNVTGSWQVSEIGVAQPSNTAGQLYVAVQDSAGRVKVVNHPDPQATLATSWQRWTIPLADFSSAGVNLAGVKKMSIGVGDRSKPTPGGAGRLYLDDIGFGRPAPGGQ